jgi:hypothetical protein
MGAHTRPKGMHRGDAAPLLDIDLRKAGAATGVAVVVAGSAVAFAAPAGAATPDDFARLRVCESNNRYTTNTGNGYYGAYQFSLQTWRGMGLTGLPSDASPAAQDAAAQKLQAARGWQPWPGCSRKLGLGGSRGIVAASASNVVVTRVASVKQRWVASTPPPFTGVVLTRDLVGEKRADVAAWQAEMRLRGWPIKVDGRFGGQSARIAQRFATEKHLTPVAPGAVDETVWNAAWTMPVT